MVKAMVSLNNRKWIMDKNPRVIILHWYKEIDDLALTIARCLRALGYEASIRYYNWLLSGSI